MPTQDVFFQDPQILEIFAITTWGCNLRCPFCFVLKNLKGDGSKQEIIDPDQLVEFCLRHHNRFGTSMVSMVLIGGEPMRAKEACWKYVEAARALKQAGIRVRMSMTTNASSHVFDEEDLLLIRELDNINISVDGVNHDRMRKKIKGEGDYSVLKRALTNIRSICRSGMASKVFIQSVFIEEEDREVFVKMLMLLGVLPERVMIGGARNTEFFKKGSSKFLRISKKPCCVFRYMGHFTIDSRGLHGNYYEPEATFLGKLDDPLRDIEKAYRQYIIEQMPAYNDPVCRSCPALDICWGGCFGSIESQELPSRYCDQQKMIEYKMGMKDEASRAD